MLERVWQAWSGDDGATAGTSEGAWSTFIAIYVWFLGLQLLDLASTLMVMVHGGAEANRWGPAQAVDAFGNEALLALKLGIIILTLVAWMPAVAWIERRGDARSLGVILVMMLSGVLVYTAVVFWNLAVLRVLLA